MSAEDYFDWPDCSDEDQEPSDWPHPYGNIRCKYCKCTGFHWVITPEGWRLATATDQLHQCDAYHYSTHT